MPLVQTTLSTTGNSGPAAIEELIDNLTTLLALSTGLFQK